MSSYPPASLNSYQSGNIPQPFYGDVQETENLEAGQAVGAWDTKLGWRLDVEAASAYSLGPISALLILVVETTSDYVRYHAYQSALLSVILSLIHLLLLILRFPSFFKWCAIALDLFALGNCALKAYRDAQSLERYPLPYIGEIANRWVGEE